MEAKHTPGPWHALGLEINEAADGDGRRIAVCDCDEPRKVSGYANARLIAAAPELLAALEAMCEASPLAALLPLENAKPFSEAYAAARAAIAKATKSA